MSLHPQLDLAHWCRVAPFPPPRPWWRRWLPADEVPEILWSPVDIAAIEQHRRVDPPSGRTTPADWFVWSTQPAVHPFLTKLGGIPHREAALPWPHDAQGRPRTFVGQICFLDSLDIVGDGLPGDVLLVFGDGESEVGTLDFHLEWSRRELRAPTLIDAVPRQHARVPTLSGVRHRTLEDTEWLTQCSKIGTTTLFIQRDATDDLVCALNSFWPRRRWPTVDREALDPEARRELGTLPLGDAGCIYVQRSGNDFIVHSDCY